MNKKHHKKSVNHLSDTVYESHFIRKCSEVAKEKQNACVKLSQTIRNKQIDVNLSELYRKKQLSPEVKKWSMINRP